MTYFETSLKIRKLMAKASGTNPEDWFLCLKARFGMQIVFRAINETLGKGEVITSPYTCITAVNPIITAGLTPVYSDIDPSNLSISKPLEKLCHPGKTRALVMQHTLGIIGDKCAMREYANKHSLILVEDSAHCLTRMARNKQGQILADISVHSFGVEKVLTRTKFGGAIYLNPTLKDSQPQLYEAISNSLLDLPQPTAMSGIRIRNYRLNNAVLQRLPQNIKPSVRNASIKAHILEPPIYPFEQDAKQGPAYAPNLWVNQHILEQLPTLPANYDRRINNVKLYQQKLQSEKFNKITDSTEPLLVFPIIFKEQKYANLAYDLLSSSGYFIRRWYSPLLYPGPNSNRKYSYNPKQAPIAEDMAPRVLCLPTDLKANDTERIISLISSPLTANKSN